MLQLKSRKLKQIRPFKAKQLLVKVLLSIVSTITVFVGLEVVLRTWFPQPLRSKNVNRFHKVFINELIPNFEGTYYKSPDTNEYDRFHVITNSEGLREKKTYGKKAPGTVRILILGDSFTFGYGVDNNEAYPKKVEQLIHQDEKDGKINFEVLNAGTGGWGTVQEVMYLKEKGPYFQPDLVILGFFLGNDVYNNLSYEEDLRIEEERSRGSVSIPFKSFFQEKSHAYTFLASRYESLLITWGLRKVPAYVDIGGQAGNKEKTEKHLQPSDLFLTSVPEQLQSGYQLTKRLLKDLAQYSEESLNAEFILMIIPERSQVNYKPGYWEKWYPTYNREIPSQIIREFAEDENIDLLDLLPVFSRIGAHMQLHYSKIDEHWNPQGHNLAALEIYKYLKQSGFFERP